MQTSFKFDGHPCLFLYPAGFEAVVCLIDRNLHHVASLDHFETAISHVGGINGDENSKVLDILDMSVCRAVNVRRETARSSKLVIYSSLNQPRFFHVLVSANLWKLTLFFEQEHILLR